MKITLRMTKKWNNIPFGIKSNSTDVNLSNDKTKRSGLEKHSKVEINEELRGVI